MIAPTCHGFDGHASGTWVTMSDPDLPPADDEHLAADDDTLPPEHPAAADAPVSAGEVLSGEGMGSGSSGPTSGPRDEPTQDEVPGDDS
jgi:hypothetical protein